MKKWLWLLLVVMLLLSLCACGGKEPAAPDRFSVGYAKVDITPSGSVPLYGVGDIDQRYSTAVMDRLYATCVAFTDTEGNTILLFGVDLLNTYGKLQERVRTAVSQETGIPENRILCSATHTHAAALQEDLPEPDVQKGMQFYVEQCLAAAKEALADRKPAQMHGTFTRPEEMNYVRHYILKDGTYRAYEIGAGTAYGHMWKADNLLQMIKFTREGGKDVILVNWQAHYAGANRLNYTGISADYPGVLRDELDQALDCHTAFVLGASGNLASDTKLDHEYQSKTYIEHGQRLAAEAIKAAENFVPLQTGTIQFEEYFYVADGTEKQNPLYAWGFGDFGMVMVPWETFDLQAVALRDQAKYTYLFYASCANASTANGYLPNADSFNYYCYEASTTKYPQGTAEQIHSILKEMLDRCFEQSGQAQKARAEGYNSFPYVPVTDGVIYINPTCGDATMVVEGENGFYPMVLMDGSRTKNILVADRDLAEAIMQRETVELIFDERYVVVGIVE